MTEKSMDDIRKEYEAKKAFFGHVEEAAKMATKKVLAEIDFKVHDVISRVKQTDSFLKKIESRQFQEPLKDLDDIVGLRVLVLFRPDIEKVGELIKKCFKLVGEDDKAKNNDASDFSYLGTHYTVTLDREWSGKQNTGLCEQKIEIQVRTLAMDAWATISHYLDYKQEIDIPDTLKRDFYALNGLFYVADTHFQMISDGREEYNRELEEWMEAKSTEADEQPINLDSLAVFLGQTFPDRRLNELDTVSELVSELKEYGITEVQQLSEITKRATAAFNNYEKNIPSHYLRSGGLLGASVVRHMLLLCNSKYRDVHIGEAMPQDLSELVEEYRIDK